MKVVDASVVMKLLIEEGDSQKVRALWEGGERFLVPDILFVEVANALATKAVATRGMLEEGIELVYGLGLEVETTEKLLLAQAARLAKQKGSAVYDMIYAVLAKKTGAELVTADARFAQKTGFSFVKVL